MKLSITIFFTIISLKLCASVYYSDPVNGSMSNNGSFSQPWGSLENIINSVSLSGGDTIYLLSGNHGNPQINGVKSGGVTILANTSAMPFCESIIFGNNSATAFWHIKNIKIQSENTAQYPGYLVELTANTSNIIIENCEISSSNAIQNWWRNDWRTRCKNGIKIEGNTHTITNNNIYNIAIGILYNGNYSTIKNNEINNFTIDAVRLTSGNLNLSNNYIHDNINVYTYTENHYDGIQLYTCCPVGQDTIENITITQNIIINTTDTTRLYNGLMQGIGGFDGWFNNLTITNNVICIDNWHGITLAGASNCKIINNTLIDPYFTTYYDSLETVQSGNVGPCWIRITQHKNGTSSFNDNLVRNNICPILANDNNIGTVDYNLLIPNTSTYNNHFVNYQNFDFHLINTSTAIDNGYYQFAPVIDKDSIARPQGSGYDIGAYEYTLLTKLNKPSSNKIVTVYPNPVKNTLHIITNNSAYKWAIFDILGHKILAGKNNSYQLQIDISSMPAGNYILQIELNSGNKISKPFIK